MKKIYQAPQVEIYKAMAQQMMALSSEEINVGGETDEIEEVKKDWNMWED